MTNNKHLTNIEKTVYLNGVALKPSYMLKYALRKIYGISNNQSNSVIFILGRSPITRLSERSSEIINSLERVLGNYEVETARRMKESDVIQKHLKLGSYRGIRLRLGRPVRGQRTRSNGRNAKRLNLRRR
jgi:small subunit ribosomal protein S13